MKGTLTGLHFISHPIWTLCKMIIKPYYWQVHHSVKVKSITWNMVCFCSPANSQQIPGGARVYHWMEGLSQVLLVDISNCPELGLPNWGFKRSSEMITIVMLAGPVGLEKQARYFFPITVSSWRLRLHWWLRFHCNSTAHLMYFAPHKNLSR